MRLYTRLLLQTRPDARKILNNVWHTLEQAVVVIFPVKRLRSELEFSPVIDTRFPFSGKASIDDLEKKYGSAKQIARPQIWIDDIDPDLTA